MARWRALLDLAIVGGFHMPCTYQALGPSFYGPQGETSFIDHLLLDDSWRDLNRKVVLLKGVAQKLQVIPDARPRDHIPVLMVLDWPTWGKDEVEQKWEFLKWDQAKLAEAH